MKKIILLISLMLLISSTNLFAEENSDTQQVVSNELTQQTEEWNKGDLNNYIASYKNDDTTRYINGTMIQGYKNILANYKSRFPTAEKMGKLTLSDIEIKVLSSEFASVVGKYHLKQGKKKSQGIFTLLFENTSNGWKIILDHTS